MSDSPKDWSGSRVELVIKLECQVTDWPALQEAVLEAAAIRPQEELPAAIEHVLRENEQLADERDRANREVEFASAEVGLASVQRPESAISVIAQAVIRDDLLVRLRGVDVRPGASPLGPAPCCRRTRTEAEQGRGTSNERTFPGVRTGPTGATNTEPGP